MAKARQLLRDVALATAMAGFSFGIGWWAYGRDHGSTRRVKFNFSQPYLVPRTHEGIGMQPTSDTAPYPVGDRIDILVQVNGVAEPLILDAIVTQQTKTNFGMLVPFGGRDVLGYARENGMQLIFRPSVVTAEPVALEPYRG